MSEANRLSNVTVRVNDLIRTVGYNRDRHREAFENALAGFRLAANHALNERIDDIAKRKVVDLHFSLPVPEDHTVDYDRVITMLDMTRDAGEDFIVLDVTEQAQYVMDDWLWKRAFTTTSTFYAGGK